MAAPPVRAGRSGGAGGALPGRRLLHHAVSRRLLAVRLRHPQRRVQHDEGGRADRLPCAAAHRRRFRARTGRDDPELRRRQALDREGRPVDALGAARADLHRRRGACDVAGRRCGRQLGDPGRGRHRKHSRACSVEAHAAPERSEQSAEAAPMADRDHAMVPGAGAETRADAEHARAPDAEAALDPLCAASLAVAAALAGAVRRRRRAAGAYIAWIPAFAGMTSPARCHICIVQPSTPIAAWRTASAKVGWAWLVRAMSSLAAPNSIASAASAMRLPASAPRMCTPSTRSVLASASTLAKPSVAAIVLARALAENGNLPVL